MIQRAFRPREIIVAMMLFWLGTSIYPAWRHGWKSSEHHPWGFSSQWCGWPGRVNHVGINGLCFFTCLNYLKDMSMFATPSVGMNKEWCFLYMPYLNVIDAPPPGPTRLSSFQRMPSQLHQFGVWPQMFDKFCMDAERTAWFMNVYEISWE